MSNSSLVNHTSLSPHNSGTRTAKIDRITPHCVVGQLNLSGLASCFTGSRGVSCNYAIATSGEVLLVVPEDKRSWCSSSPANDQRAVTIECASDRTSPYAFNDNVWNKLHDLCTDICRRNGKSKLIWIPDKNQALNYTPKSDEMLLTVHRWFSNTICPGDWLMARLGSVAVEVTNRLGGQASTPAPAPAPATPSAPAFPLPSGWYFGPKTGPKESVSGYYSHREDLRRWQQRMKDRGWKINPDGLYGNETATVAKKFQAEKGLTVDGKIGVNTWNAAWTAPIT